MQDMTEREQIEEQLRASENRFRLAADVDVTKRNEAEVRLRYSEQLHRIAFDQSPIGMSYVGADGRFIKMNLAMCELTGYGAEELVGMMVSDLTHPDDQAHDTEIFAPFLRGDTPIYANEKRYVRKGGGVRWVAVTARMVTDADGRPLHTVGVSADITERKLAEATQREIAERLRLAIAGSNLGTWHWDIRTGALDWSEQCLEIFGLSPRTAMSYEKFLGVLHPEDRARADDAVQYALQNRSEYRIDFRNVWPDGSVHWAISSGRAYYDAAGEPTRMEGIALDITERKHAEEARHKSDRNYRALVTASSAVMYRMSADWSKLHQLDGQDFIVDTPAPSDNWVEEYLYPEDQAQILAVIREAIRTKSHFEMEHRIRRVDGSVGWIFSHAVPLLDAKGEIVEWLGAASDVTARKQAEQALADRSELLNGVMEGTTDVIFIKDLNGRILLANAAFAIAANSTPEQLVGKTDEDLFPPEVAAAIRQHDKAVIAGGSPTQLEESIPVAGEPRAFLTLKAPLRDGGGRVVGVLGISRDVTERKRAEEEQRLLASIVEYSSDFIGISDAEGNPLYGNRAAMELVGVEDLEQVRRSKIVDYFVPEQRQFVAEVVLPAVIKDGRWCGQLSMRHFVTGATIPVLYDLFRVDDPVTGRPVNFATITRDLTGQKTEEDRLRRSEARLRRVFESNVVGMIRWDLDRSLILDANAEFIRMTGFTRDDVAAGRVNFRDLTPPEWASRNEQGIRDILADGHAAPYEKEYFRKDGSRVPLIIAGTRFEDSPSEGMSFVIDISETKRAETDLRVSEERLRLIVDSATGFAIFTMNTGGIIDGWNAGATRLFGYAEAEVVGRHDRILYTPEDAAEKIPEREIEKAAANGQAVNERWHARKDGSRFWGSGLVQPLREGGRIVGFLKIMQDMTEARLVKERLQEADRKKDEFLATLAHELRNPLAPLRNGLQIMKLAGANGAVEQARAMMDRQLTQLVRLVDDLLDVSRISSGKLKLDKERVELRAVIDAAVETSRPAIEEARHELVVIVPNEPIYVVGDAIRLAQVVTNLLNNSAKYTLKGGHIMLTVGREDGMAVVSVEDDGIGIPPAMLGRVFEMFTQVDRTLEKTTGGLGIGLSLAKGLLVMHGGTIEAKSDGEDMGSKFVIRMPLAMDDVVELKCPDGHTSELAPSAPWRILVVDDNADAAESLGQLLEMSGHEVRTAENGEAGIDVAARFRPHIVLMDIGMPKLNGYEAARRMRQYSWSQNMVLVALTGWGQEDDRKKSAEAGFNYHLVKPVEMGALDDLLSGLNRG